MEAAQTLTNEILKDKKDDGRSDESSGEESDDGPETKPNIENKDDFRSNSIAALRAKAQEHSARFFSDGHKLFEHPASQELQQQQQQQLQQQQQQRQMFPSIDNTNPVF